MIINALEATEESGEIRVFASSDQRRVSFSVWNAASIPEEIGRRIFQRNFSTKGESGRGIGTFSMKFFGESILGGTIDFRSSEAEGTTFVLTLPRTKALPEKGPCA
jgi:sensor histidine kinase regulating citrate/malate metabolism